MRYLILLLLICSSVDSLAKRKDIDLDRWMNRQLKQNSKHWHYVAGAHDIVNKVDSVKQVLDGGGFYITNDIYPRCITKSEDIELSYCPWIISDTHKSLMASRRYQIGKGDIIDWVWLGDVTPLYVDIFKCNDLKIEKFVQEKLVAEYNKMTVLYRSYNVPMLRIDTINGETVIGTAMYDGYSEHQIYLVTQKKQEYLKGITVINGVTVLLFGNAIENYFKVTDQNRAMPAPLPPHKSNYKEVDKLYPRVNKYQQMGYYIYKRGKIRYNKSIKIEQPFYTIQNNEWEEYDDFIIHDLFLGIIEETQKSKGIKTISAEDKFDPDLFKTRIHRINNNLDSPAITSDSLTVVTGIIVDKDSSTPIEGVQIIFFDNPTREHNDLNLKVHKSVSNSKGEFRCVIPYGEYIYITLKSTYDETTSNLKLNKRNYNLGEIKIYNDIIVIRYGL